MNSIRSLLFVPAEDKRLAKIGMTNADAYIVDLEDSIGEEFKDEALRRTVEFLKSCNTKNVFVRINKHRREKELNALGVFNVGYVLPKFQDSSDYSDVSDYFRDCNVIALMESPRAIMNANSIAAISWIDALAFGAEDFTVTSGMKNSCEYLFVSKSILALSAKANGKKVFDTPCFQLMGDEALKLELEQSVNLGYDGKLAIHPKQIDRINHAFQLNNPEYAKHVIERFEASGLAVCEIDGRVYEQMHINRLKERLLHEADF